MIWSELELRWVLLGLGLLVVLGVFLGGLIKPRSRAPETPRFEPEIWHREPQAAIPAADPVQPQAAIPAAEPVQPQKGFASSSGPSPPGGRTATEPVRSQKGFAAGVEEGAAQAGPRGRLGGFAAGVEEGGGSPGAAADGILPEGDSGEHPDEGEAATGSAGAARDTERVVGLRLIPREGGELDAERTVRALRNAGLRHGPYGIFHHCGDRNVPESGFSVANLVEPGSFDLSNLPDSTLPGVTFFMVLPGSRDPVERFDTMIGIARDLCQSLDARLLDDLGNSWTIQRERYLREELMEYRRRQSSN